MVKRIISVCAAGVISSASTATPTKDDDAARKAAIEWLELVDAGKYQEAASQASQEIRGFEQWLNHLATQRGPLGRVNKRHFVEMNHASTVAGVPEVRGYHVIRFKTSFERTPSATEQITIAKVGCCWEIFGYEIK